MRTSDKQISIGEAKALMKKAESAIFDLLYVFGDENDNLPRNEEDIDYTFERDQLCWMANKLDEVYGHMRYLKKDIVDQGFIKKNDSGRYELPSGDYFTSGSPIEVLYTDRYNEQSWIVSRVEHNGDDYYVVNLPKEKMDGMMVRVRGRN